MHVIEWMWDYLDTSSRICMACTCIEFYGEISELWKHVIIPDTIPIDNDNLLPILVCAQNIETLTINFPYDMEEEEASEAMIKKMMEKYNMISTETNEHKQNDKKHQKTKTKPIKFPSDAINPSFLPHLKQIQKIDFKTCPTKSYETFISAFYLMLSKFITLSQLCIPQLFTIRHNCLEILDIHQLQIGFDGMNIHIGADLIGITHFKKQLPNIKIIYVDELYLFIGQEIYINHEKSGKQYWVVMRKYSNDVNVKIIFRNPVVTIMLMPRSRGKKTPPPLICEKWENIKDWVQDRLGQFICLQQN